MVEISLTASASVTLHLLRVGVECLGSAERKRVLSRPSATVYRSRMLPRVLLATALVPDTKTKLQLFQSGDLFSIMIPGRGDLMNSRVHGSEKALAQLACEQLGDRPKPRLLIGGLGMGFTLAAALNTLGADAHIVVAELVPEVVEWNRTLIGAPAGNPLADARASVYVGDVADVIRREPRGFDAILMDVDNGPEALVRRENNWLYGRPELETTRAA